MNYTLNIGIWNSVFAVPSSIVDEYIRLASGNSLKLILFLLRHSNETYSAERLRTELGFSELGELEDAAVFWVQRGVIRYSSEEDGWFTAAQEKQTTTLSAVENNQTKSEGTENTVIKIETTPKSVKKVSPELVSTSEITKRINEDKDIQALFAEAEKIYGKPLVSRDSNAVISLIDHYGFSIPVALMLLQYCSRCNKLTPASINSAAEKWISNAITTVELADNKLRTLENIEKMELQLLKIIESSDKFESDKEKNIQKTTLRKNLNIWVDEWQLSNDLILLAINKTIEIIEKPALKYAGKILENWTKEGLTTVEQVEQLENPAKANSSSTSSSFDMDDVMAKIKNRYKG